FLVSGSLMLFFFFSSRRRHTRSKRDWSSDVCSSDLPFKGIIALAFIMLILSTVAGMIIPYLVMVFIDDYLTPAVFPEGEITMLVAVYLIVQIIGAITTYMNIYLFQYLAFKIGRAHV